MSKKFHQSLTDSIISKTIPKKTDKPDNYFEATFQLRNPTKELSDFFVNQTNKREDTFISEVIPLKEGVDIKLSSQRFARGLGAKLRKSFKGELTSSRKLFTVNHQTSKRLYRVTVCFRMEKIEKKETTEEDKEL